MTIAQHHAKLGNKHDAATNYVDASNCFKKSDPKGKLYIKLLALTSMVQLKKTSRSKCVVG